VHTIGRFVGQEDLPVAFDYTLIVTPGR